MNEAKSDSTVLLSPLDECSHPYLIARGVLNFCLTCKQFVTIKEEPKQELVMPPVIFEITERLWKKITPWPHIGAQLVQKHQWYISMLNSQDYLIMPILKNGYPVYYSARRLGEGNGLKYQYPKGVKKSLWVSTDALEQDPIIICEGVADAVYCSQISSSVAVLGSYYNGSLDSLFINRDIVLCFDGDTAGIIAAVNIMSQLKNVRSKRMVVLPKDNDPTDVEINKLTEYIKEEIL